MLRYFSVSSGIDNAGWVVELEPNVWLLNSDPAHHSRCTKLENATRWWSERSAQRAMSRIMKYCRRKFDGFKIYRVDQ